MGAAELGAAYAALLDGGERKATGSYYTPPELVERLLDSALEPVLDQTRDRPGALLAVTVCDPACGAGYFLVAAARRIARRLPAPRGAAGCRPPVHLRRRREPDGGRADQDRAVAGGGRTGSAVRPPGHPHQARQLADRRAPGNSRRRPPARPRTPGAPPSSGPGGTAGRPGRDRPAGRRARLLPLAPGVPRGLRSGPGGRLRLRPRQPPVGADQAQTARGGREPVPAHVRPLPAHRPRRHQRVRGLRRGRAHADRAARPPRHDRPHRHRHRRQHPVLLQ